LVGAFVFRLAAIVFAAFLLRWHIVKLLGGGYLIYVAGKYFFFEAGGKVDEKFSVGADGAPILLDEGTGQPLADEQVEEEIKARIPVHVPVLEPSAEPPKKYPGFWSTVGVIELTDIAFAIDSILAAIALVGPAPPDTAPGAPHPKLWVVVAGGMLGVILMRFAAVVFIKLLERFPRFEVSAYLLVAVIGGKLVADFAFNRPGQPPRLDFHDHHSAEFWTFWLVMLVCFLAGFVPQEKKTPGGVIENGGEESRPGV
jgi:YkoY family integral membrane protein